MGVQVSQYIQKKNPFRWSTCKYVFDVEFSCASSFSQTKLIKGQKESATMSKVVSTANHEAWWVGVLLNAAQLIEAMIISAICCVIQGAWSIISCTRLLFACPMVLQASVASPGATSCTQLVNGYTWMVVTICNCFSNMNQQPYRARKIRGERAKKALSPPYQELEVVNKSSLFPIFLLILLQKITLFIYLFF